MQNLFNKTYLTCNALEDTLLRRNNETKDNNFKVRIDEKVLSRLKILKLKGSVFLKRKKKTVGDWMCTWLPLAEMGSCLSLALLQNDVKSYLACEVRSIYFIKFAQFVSFLALTC